MSGRALRAGLTAGFDRLEANTMSGQIAADVTLRAGGDVRVRTMSGDVTLRLPAGSDAQVRLQSTSGAVRSEFESLRTAKAPASHTVSGNVGAGTGRVSVSTMSGYGDASAASAPGRKRERDPMTPVFRHGRLRLYLLRLLDEEPRHGYEVIRLLRDRFMGVYAPSPGTIYPRLARLEDEGLVTHDEENGRKVYRITEAGREELRSRGAELDELEEELSESVSDIAREFGEDVRRDRPQPARGADAGRPRGAAERARHRPGRGRGRPRGRRRRPRAGPAGQGGRLERRPGRPANAPGRRATRPAATPSGCARRPPSSGSTPASSGAAGATGASGATGTSGPGRAHDLGALRDFERLAREFVTDLRSVAWDSSSVLGSEVIPALRDILSETLERIQDRDNRADEHLSPVG